VTGAIIMANLAVWVIQVALGASPMSPDAPWLFAHGGNLGAATLEGEEWRLLTSMFVHAGALHLGMNVLGLLGGGPLIERLYGRFGFAAIYLISGLTGSLTSTMRPGVVSVGASGAIFGVLGALGAFYALHRERMDQRTAKQAGGLLVFVGYNLLFGFAATGIDMYAHVGGLAGGFLCGLAIEVGRTGPRLPRTAVVAGIGLIAVISAAYIVPTHVTDEQRALDAFTTVEKEVVERWNGMVAEVQRDGISDDELADRIEKELLPRWIAAREAIERSGAGGARRPTLLDYLRARQEGWEIMASGLRAHDRAEVERGTARSREADALARRVSEPAS
jgi:rhomboid protease GluP